MIDFLDSPPTPVDRYWLDSVANSLFTRDLMKNTIYKYRDTARTSVECPIEYLNKKINRLYLVLE